MVSNPILVDTAKLCSLVMGCKTSTNPFWALSPKREKNIFLEWEFWQKAAASVFQNDACVSQAEREEESNLASPSSWGGKEMTIASPLKSQRKKVDTRLTVMYTKGAFCSPSPFQLRNSESTLMNSIWVPACCGACGLGCGFWLCPPFNYKYQLFHGQTVSGYQLVPLSLRDFKGPLKTNGSSVSGRYKHAEETEAPWTFWLETPSLTSLVPHGIKMGCSHAGLVASFGVCVSFSPLPPCQHQKLRPSLDSSIAWKLTSKRGPLTLPGFSELVS